VWSTAHATVITYLRAERPNEYPNAAESDFEPVQTATLIRLVDGSRTRNNRRWLFEVNMAKAYWITCYHQITDPAKLASYAKLAAPAIEAGGGRFLARTTAVKAYEHGKVERTVLIEFDSVEQAAAVHDSAAYQAALVALGDGAVRDMRIVPGV
jgi:uncharacterized protein (DUF1330 family)